MFKIIYLAVLVALVSLMCYMIPQAFDKENYNGDNLVNNHKTSINY